MSKPLKIVVTDDNGDIILEGFVTSYSITIKNPYIRTFDIQGMQSMPTQPKNFSIGGTAGIDFGASSPDPGRPPVKATQCNHEWAKYQGLVESYEYCKLCGEKENSNTDPKFANTYAQDSWRRK